jgi:ATP adenylyltransferase
MKQLWSPWRMSYIDGHEPSNGCIFCEALKIEDGVDNLVVARGQRAFVMLNRFPYTNGHLLIVPQAHQPSIELLDAATRGELMEWLNLALQALRLEYHAAAFNMGANLGAAAGAGVADHVHFHVVPRWAGDTNFMSVVSDIRVLPEDLAVTWKRMKQRFDSMV